MTNYFASAFCAAALLLSSTAVDAVLAPASAQSDDSVDFDTFHDALAPYGDWVYSDRWGEVWIPEDVPDNFHPYGTGGHWGYTDDYGWTWVSEYEWGDIPFHYGRWVNDPEDGWLWIPGYVWSPGWVIWRSNGQYTGWMPMPPDEDFLTGSGAGFGISAGGFHVSLDYGDTGNYYGYGQWYGSNYGESQFAANWVFVGTAHVSDRDYARYEAPRANYTAIIHNTTNITHYTVVNNYIVNKSFDAQTVEHASGHRVLAISIGEAVHKPQFVTHADAGRAVQERMRATAPRGNGRTGSAPQPSPKVVQSLSPNIGAHRAKAPMHLFTRDTVAKAPLAPARHEPLPLVTPAKPERHDNEMGVTNEGPMSRQAPGGKLPPVGAMTHERNSAGTVLRHPEEAPSDRGHAPAETIPPGSGAMSHEDRHAAPVSHRPEQVPAIHPPGAAETGPAGTGAMNPGEAGSAAPRHRSEIAPADHPHGPPAEGMQSMPTPARPAENHSETAAPRPQHAAPAAPPASKPEPPKAQESHDKKARSDEDKPK
jgi:hypothetical protein